MDGPHPYTPYMKFKRLGFVAAAVAIAAAGYYAGQHSLKLEAGRMAKRADRQPVQSFSGAWGSTRYGPAGRNAVSGACDQADGVCVVAETVVYGNRVKTYASLYKIQSWNGATVIATRTGLCDEGTLTVEFGSGTVERHDRFQPAPGQNGAFLCGDAGYDYVQHLQNDRTTGPRPADD